MPNTTGSQGQLTVNSYPEFFFSGESRTVLEDSVVWLYCQINSNAPSLGVVWSKDNIPLIQDVPHIRLRNSKDANSSTLILILDDVGVPDSGVYQCRAQNNGATAVGESLVLRGIDRKMPSL